MRRVFPFGLLAMVGLSVACGSTTEEAATSGASAASATAKTVIVSLEDQRARAFEGERCVREWPISTGSVGNETWRPFLGKGITPKDKFTFPILGKEEVVEMTDPTGQGRYTDVEVYWDVRLTSGGIYFHEANWTNLSGTSTDCGHCGFTGNAPWGTSHGCINERHDDAVWFYDWAPPANASVNVVTLSFEPFAPTRCDVVTAVAADNNAGSASDPNQVQDITYDDCLKHQTHCLEDLANADGSWSSRWICWKSGATSSTGKKICQAGQWLPAP